MSTFKLRVISAEGRFFDGECESLVFPTLDGKTGILADHCNMLGAVTQGIAEFTTPDGTRHEVAVDEGFVKVEDNDVLLLVGIAEDPEKSEANRARREAQRLKEEELLRRSIREYKEAQATVAKTVNTLRGVDKVERIQ